MRGIFDGRYKLVIHLLDYIDEFYDLETDPYEMNNLIMDFAYPRNICFYYYSNFVSYQDNHL